MTNDIATEIGPIAADTPLAIRGVLLRSVLLLELDRAGNRTMTVADLCASMERRGFTVPGRASKVVSDALRWEIARGRVRRWARGCYAIGSLPRTTRWRCHQRVRAARAGAAPEHHVHTPRATAARARRRDMWRALRLRPETPTGPVVARRGNAPHPSRISSVTATLRARHRAKRTVDLLDDAGHRQCGERWLTPRRRRPSRWHGRAGLVTGP